MTGSVNRGKNPNKFYPHYTCGNRECEANPKNITASKVENDYRLLLESIAIDQELLELAKVVAMRIWDQKVKAAESGLVENEKKIKEIERQIDEYIELIPTTRSEAIKSRYEAKVEGLDKRIKELQKVDDNKKEPNFEEALTLTLKFLGTPAETWINAGQELKTMIHTMIFDENPKYSLKTGFRTPNLSLPFRINHTNTDLNIELVEVAGVTPASSAPSSAVLHAQMRAVRSRNATHQGCGTVHR